MAEHRPLTPCTGCEVPTVGSYTWKRMSKAERVGLQRHSGHGLCPRCYSRERRQTPATRSMVPRAVVVEEWEWLDHDRMASRAQRVRTAAARLGMTPDALDKALTRAGVAA